ncbi:putative LRR receptor-like serine/threonine-protein kinase [Forsythia ovata]|uniref:LRR receptor-like serine/threonine-protein kinase n=1 Tax=Forsythia ovata TaxID=205694 RepID=A0ABD1QLP0_9LAMI
MSNRDLSTSLFNKYYKESDGDLPSRDWITRMKIAIGAAEEICKASSILLDDNFEVRIGSLSQAGAVEMETHTHENRITRTLGEDTSGIPNATCAYDVYCFGKILLELVTGKLGISGCSNSSTEKWLETTLTYISRSDKDLVTNIMDPSLVVDEDLLEEVWVMAIVARTCLDPKPRRRPFMRYILRALENPLEVVREEYISSNRTTSSAEVWTAALFGSWSKSLWSGQS